MQSTVLLRNWEEIIAKKLLINWHFWQRLHWKYWANILLLPPLMSKLRYVFIHIAIFNTESFVNTGKSTLSSCFLLFSKFTETFANWHFGFWIAIVCGRDKSTLLLPLKFMPGKVKSLSICWFAVVFAVFVLLCLILWCTVDTFEEQWQNMKPLWAIIYAIMGS